MMRRVVALGGAPVVLVFAVLQGCGGADLDDAAGSSPPPSATSYVVVDPPTTTAPPTTVPPSTDASGNIVTTTTLPTEYVVQANDSVFKIASRFGLEPEELAEINGWSDGIRHTILPGDTIRIAVPPTTAPTTGSVPAPGECPTTYTIQAGDTTRIAVAERFGITFEEMDAANEDTPGYDNFVVGTEIVIPCPS
jgi:LysM repeat protein